MSLPTFQRTSLNQAVSLAMLSMIASQVCAEENKEQQDTLEVITVTATKSPTNLMKTPVAVTAMNEESLRRQDVTEVRNLSGLIPNIQLGLSASDSGVQASIRGVTSTNFTEIGDPAVGIHIDGLYSPRPQGALALMYDLEQVEALRGPQGTLFGRNATAGVINIITNKPNFDEKQGSITLDKGNYNKTQVRSMFNMPIADNFAVRGTFMMEKRDGYLNQTQDFTDRFGKTASVPDGKPDVDQRYNVKVRPQDYYTNADHWGARGSARWAPSDNIDTILTYESYQNNGAGEVNLLDCEDAKGTKFECQGDHFSAQINVPGEIDMSIDTIRSITSWQINEQTTLEYRLAYAQQSRYQQQDSDAGLHPHPDEITVSYDQQNPIPAGGNWGTWQVDDRGTWTLDSDYDSVVHELQLKQTFDNWRYVAGAFWMNEENTIEFAQNSLVIAPFGYPYGQYYDQDREVDAKAIFAQADIKLTEQLSVTLGLRYSEDEKIDRGGYTYGNWDAYQPWYYNGDFDVKAPGTVPTTAHNGYELTQNMGEFAPYKTQAYGEPTKNAHKMDWDKTTWRLGAQYDLNPDEMVFISAATGYKAGGYGDKFDICGGSQCVGQPEGPIYSFLPYEPETTTNFEVGYKGVLMDGKLNLSSTLFFTQFDDMQVTGSHVVGQKVLDENQVCPGWNPACDMVTAWKTENIGESEIKGLELEYDFIPWQDGRLSGYLAWLDTQVVDYKTYADNLFCGYRDEYGAEPCPEVYLGEDPALRGRQIYDVTGNQLPYSPEFSLAIGYSHDIDLGGGYALIPWVQVRWQDDMYFSVRNLDNQYVNDRQDAYVNVDATVKLMGPDGDWYLEAYVNNATDEIIQNWWDHDGGYSVGSYNPPRMYGVRAHFNF
ncbi:TonB-dependent receptor [Catenovulum sp. SM1970]|uniref:TonB-dependent receptor n=1 Tax=Marinifaba aquimaris TaxID=2741323 RepID=UPI0015721A3C|nr:TonB-dependent receptor [Marinifaba aquimaris]NTS78522.1 TonB-dependent receptor [Marinifaba aquimaris]